MKFSTIALALSAAIFSTQSFAAVSSFATLGPIKIQLIDLNPTDGVGPSLTWNYSDFTTSSVQLVVEDSGSSLYSLVNSANIGSGISDNLSFGNSSASAAVSQSNDVISLAGTFLSASGNSSGASSAGSSSSYDATAKIPYYGSMNGFTLSAYTAAIFSAEATVSSSITDGISNNEFASGLAYLSVNGTQPGGDFGTQDSFSRVYSVSTYSVSSDYQSALLAGSYVNFTNADKVGYFDAKAAVYGFTNAVTAVPEADTYAMMFAGLGLIGFIASRKKKQA